MTSAVQATIPHSEIQEWKLPTFMEVHQIEDIGDIWSIKFYSFTAPGVDTIFAVTGSKCILIYRIAEEEGRHDRVEAIQVLVDEELGANHYACAWTKDLNTGEPWLCVGGENGKIRVFKVLTAECTFIGHGGAINDIAVSPINPSILASASDDSTIRIWTLDPVYSHQPCAAILAGAQGSGHKEQENVLSIAFHQTGRYILSSGKDHLINLWTLPLLPDERTGTQLPTRIYNPHFSTSQVHASFIDCVMWYGDLIFSKAYAEENIVLWSIKGFSSSLVPPSPDTAPTYDQKNNTRSSFYQLLHGIPTSELYTRHLQLSIPDPVPRKGDDFRSILFTRFGLFSGTPAHPHPVIAHCNTNSKIYFFDLCRFENYFDIISSAHASSPHVDPAEDGCDSDTMPKEARLHDHPFLRPWQARKSSNSACSRSRPISNWRASSPTGSLSPRQTAPYTVGDRSMDQIDWAKSNEMWADHYYMGDPQNNTAAHSVEVVPKVRFCGRQVAWSQDGTFCIVAGSNGVVAIFRRWRRG